MFTEKMVVPFKVKEIKEDDDKNTFSFEGYASTFGNVDLGDDVVEQGAFKTSINEFNSGNNKLKVLWQHNHDMPIGVFKKFFEDSKGLFVKGVLPKDDSFVAGRVIPQMKIGSIDKMSIGYSVRDKGADYIDDIRHLKDIKLWEVSLVTIPMNDQADVTGFKSLPFQDLPIGAKEREWSSISAIGRIKAFTNSEETPSKQYRKAFLWFDKDNSDDFDAYKLPIADVVNDKLTAVPKGIFAAAAVMRGARGGVDMPDTDKAGIVKNLERYYSKMDLDSPFKEEDSFIITSFKDHDPRDIEHLLIQGKLVLPRMSKRQAVKYISALKRGDLFQRVEEKKEDWSDILTGINKLKKQMEV